ncbi:hypothetical protein LTR94_035710, partial [Friedmanniomyces endolithicus]
RLEHGYARWLDGALRKPLLPLLGVVLFLGVAGFFFTRLPSELAPAEDTGVVEAQISAPEGTGFARMMAYMKKIEDDLAFLRKDGTLQNLVIRTPSGFGATDDYNGGN